MIHPLEVQLRAAGQVPMRFGPAGRISVDEARLDENLAMIHAELDAAPEPRFARLLRRIGVPDLTVPVVAATPALRRSWFIAVAVAVLFALSASSNTTGTDAERIVVFLTLAPLVPLAGVALAFGRSVDPAHQLMVAAPRDTFRVFLIRATTVLVAGAGLLIVASALLPTGGAYRFAWLLPALAITTATMAASVGVDPRRVAAALATVWIVVVLIVSQAASVEAMFGAGGQLGAMAATILSVMVLLRRRRLIEVGGRP